MNVTEWKSLIEWACGRKSLTAGTIAKIENAISDGVDVIGLDRVLRDIEILPTIPSIKHYLALKAKMESKYGNRGTSSVSEGGSDEGLQSTGDF